MSRYTVILLCVAALFISGCSLFQMPEYEPNTRVSQDQAARQAMDYLQSQAMFDQETQSITDLELTTHIPGTVLESEEEPQEKAITILFNTGTSEPDAVDLEELQRIAGILNTDPLAKAVIEGHSDNVGDEEKNLVLSRIRAESICSILSDSFGVAPEQLSVKAYGEEHPVADNVTSEGRRQNRRVVLALFPSSEIPGGGSADDAFREQKTRQAMALMEQGKTQEAYDILSELLRAYPEDDTINFHLGMAAYKLGKYPMALFSFERILMRRPDQDRVRLELAVTHVAMEQYEQAEKHFNIVLSHNPPEQVRKNIEGYLAALNHTEETPSDTTFSGSVAVGWFYDTNSNVGPRDSSIDTNIGTVLLSEDSQPIKDNGLTAAANLSVSHNINKNVALFVDLSHYQKRYFHENEYNLMSYSASPGVRVLIDDHLIQTQGRYQHLHYDANPLLDIYGPRLTYAYLAGKNVQLVTDLFWDFRDNHEEDDRDSQYFSGGEYLRVFWGPNKNEFMTGIRFFGENANEERYSNHGWELTGYVDFKMDYGVTPYLLASYRATEWNGTHSALASDDRYDQMIRMKAGIAVELFLEGLSLDASLEVINNSSNFDASTYNKYVPGITLSYEF